MKKLIISGVSKGTEINAYVFIKEQEFIENIISFLKDLGFREYEDLIDYPFTTENYIHENGH